MPQPPSSSSVTAVAAIPRAAAPPAAAGARSASGAPFRLTALSAALAIAAVVIVAIFATDQVVPATSAYEAQIRVWLAARAAGLASLGLLALQIVMGLLLSHPTNRTTWKQSKRVFPWHEHLWVFVMAFIAIHVVSIVIDPYAGVGIGGALVPGLSSYRSAPVALGSLALYAFVVTAITARYTKLLPPGLWLVLHRFALVVFILSWLHGVLAGTDSLALMGLYILLGVLVGGAAAYRYWIVRQPLHRSSPNAEQRGAIR